MKKLTINEASVHFGVSKEAIHNRVRRGSLNSVSEDGIKYVFIDENSPSTTKKVVTKSRTPQNSDDKYYKLLEEQNAKLQQRVEFLETETRTLRDQKELMLVQEREKIEQIYKEKDEQLKNILASFSAQFLPETPTLLESEEAVEVEIEEVKPLENIVTLKQFLKDNVSEKKYEKIKNRFIKKAKKDSRIKVKKGKYYLDLVKYDYSDLLK